MRGKDSDSSKDTFYNQPAVPVSHLCRTDIANLDSECFMAGKRGSVGVSPNMLKQVKYDILRLPLYKSLSHPMVPFCANFSL